MSVCLRLSPIAAIVVALSITGAAFAQDKPTRVRGEIVSLDGSMMTVKSIDGSDMKIKLPDNVGISGVVPFRIEEIKPNSYIGCRRSRSRTERSAPSTSMCFPKRCAVSPRGTFRGTISRKA